MKYKNFFSKQPEKACRCLTYFRHGIFWKWINFRGRNDRSDRYNLTIWKAKSIWVRTKLCLGYKRVGGVSFIMHDRCNRWHKYWTIWKLRCNLQHTSRIEPFVIFSSCRSQLRQKGFCFQLSILPECMHRNTLHKKIWLVLKDILHSLNDSNTLNSR